MRIVLTTNLYLPESSGGTETLVRAIASELRSRGHTVVIVTISVDKPLERRDGRFDEYIFDSIRVVRFTQHSQGSAQLYQTMRNDYDNPEFARGFRELLDEFRPDVVHFHHLWRASVKAVDACRQSHVPVFLTVTDFWYVCPMQTLLLSDGSICSGPLRSGANCLKHIAGHAASGKASALVDRIPNAVLGAAMAVARRIDLDLRGVPGAMQSLAKRPVSIAGRYAAFRKIFVPTRHAQNILEDNSTAPKANFHILPFAIADHGYERRIRSRGNAPLVVGYIGQFLPHKGLHVVMQAMRMLPTDSPVKLKVYAKQPHQETPYAADFFAQARSDARIAYEGTFENTLLPKILDGIDVLVIPSIWHENMPLVSLSAQAAGCPLVASDIGGLSDIVAHDVNGLLFEPGSAQNLRDCLLRLLTDENMLTRLSMAARTAHSMGQYVDVLEQEYCTALGDVS